MNRKKWLTQPSAGHHLFQVYSDSITLCESVSLYSGAALEQGHGVVLVVRDAHAEGIRSCLREKQFAVEALQTSGQLAIFNAEETLDRFMLNGYPDPQRFSQVIGQTIEQACGRWTSIRTYGEMVDVLWQSDRREAAIQLEELWNGLLKKQTFSLLCGYRMDRWNWENYSGPLQSICQKHSHFIPAEDDQLWNSAVDRALNETLDAQDKNVLEKRMNQTALPTRMPAGAAKLLHLGRYLPRLNVKVVHRAGQHYRNSAFPA